MSIPQEIEEVLNSRLLRFAQRSDCLKTSDGVVVCEVLRYLLTRIHQLAQNVQFSEFTKHGLPHINSLVERVSEWTVQLDEKTTSKYLVETLAPNEAFLLTFSVFTHDIGMLSQKFEDLPILKRYSLAPQFVDLPMWVRRTHVHRLRGLVLRLLRDNPDLAELASGEMSPFINAGILLAESHNEWPSTPPGHIYSELSRCSSDIHIPRDRLAGLAAVLAVADLLDEDDHRCDTDTLLGHKQATTLSRSHWLRHLLVLERPMIRSGEVHIAVAPIRSWKKHLPATMKALRLYLEKAQVTYNNYLRGLDAIIEITIEDKEEGNALHVAKLDYFGPTPDVHLLRAFPWQWDQLTAPTSLPEQLTNNAGQSEQIKNIAAQAKNILPTDHDSIITLRATHQAKDKVAIGWSKKVVRRDAMEARMRGEIALALKLSRECKMED